MKGAGLIYSSTCPHCKEAGPAMEKIVKENNGDYNGIKIYAYENTRDADEIAKHNVNGFPTFFVQKDDGSYDYEQQPTRTEAGIQQWLVTLVGGDNTTEGFKVMGSLFGGKKKGKKVKKSKK